VEPGASEQDLASILVLVDASPRLQSLREEITRETGILLQESFIPNPVLRIGVENMPIEDFGLDRGLLKIRLAQRLEVAGQPGARVDRASARRDLAEAVYFRERAALQAEAARDFFRILFTQRKLDSARRALEYRRELYRLAEELNETGRLTDLRFLEQDIAAARAAVGVEDLEGRVQELLRDLEGKLGVAAGTIAGIDGDGPDREPLEAEEAVAAILRRNPDLILADRAVAVARADLVLQERKAYPDLTVGLGYSRGDRAMNGGSVVREDFLLGFIEVPLPLIDRNQGARAAAEAQIRQGELNLENEARRVLGKWHGLRKRWERLRLSRNLYGERILPRLEERRALIQQLVTVGRSSKQESLEAALAVEKSLAEALTIDLALAELRCDLYLLTGESQL